MQTPLVHIKKFALLYGVFIAYTFGGMVLGDLHPFSTYYMYNNIPNWSYAFYLIDEHNHLIPSEKLNTTGVALGFLYGSIAEKQNIPYGYGCESAQELKIIGEKMLATIDNKALQKTGTIKLVRVYYCIQNNKIVRKLDLMCIRHE
jgi:hypothetical protein